MSSDGIDPVRRSVAEEPNPADPWFEPGPKVAAEEPDPAPVADGSGQADVFLPGGRAGLLPGSMTESWDDDDTAVLRPVQAGGADVAGAPPWGREGAAAAGERPPWETGPWPGPGEAAVQGPAPGAAAPHAGVPAVLDRAGEGDRLQYALLIAAGAAALALVVVIVLIVTS